MAGKRIAISTRSKDARKFSGPSCPLDKTEPPIFRQIIQYNYFLVNTYPHLTSFAICKLIAKDVIDIWKTVNPSLPLLKEVTVVNKVRAISQSANQINRKSLRVTQIKVLEKKLDTLFDISSCFCKLPVVSCDDHNVKCNKINCQVLHIICTCPLKQKVPVEDREYLKDQRAKIGLKGNFQIGPTDKSAIKKYKRKIKRLDKENVDSSPIASTSNLQDDVSSHSQSSSPSEETEDEYLKPDGHHKGPYSLIKIPRYAIELIRGDVSSNLGASLANALLLDLSAMGLLIRNVDIDCIFIDKCKIDRAKAKVKESALQKHCEKMENLVCIGVDGRTDKETLMYKEIIEENGEKSLHKFKGPERHLTFTKEMSYESEYLTHRVLPNTGATGAVLAEKVADVLREYNSVSTVKAILVDNTNVNTGCEGGLVTLLEKKLNRNLHTIGCSLHQNELPFRALFRHVDGTTKSPTSFNGPLGKLCGNDYNDLPQISFSAVGSPLDSSFPIVNKDILSCDQRLLYEYTVGIFSGKVDPRFASWKIGPLNQARWLTLAIRLMCLWTRGTYPQNLSTELHNLIKYIVDVYAICWFEIKKDKFHNQQLYIFNMIQRIKKQPSEIQHITLKNIQYNAFALLPENVLYSMVKSDDLEVREEALKRILSIRSGELAKKRLKKIPTINFEATHWSHLIDLSQSGVCEPALTEEFSENELRESSMNGTKLDLPDLPSHSQGVERAVKLTTEASQLVYGFEARHRHTIAKILCHKLRPSFSSKGSYMELFDTIY